MHPITLRSGLDHERTFLSRALAHAKLGLRALAHRRTTRAWLDLLNSHDTLRELVRVQPRLVHKVYRPWLTTCFDGGMRVAALAAHYRLALRLGWGPLLLQAARGPVALHAFEGKSGAVYTVALRAVVPMERDGELVLELRRAEAGNAGGDADGGGTLVYSTAFSFLPDGALGIGCIQGPKGDGLGLCRDATRDLHGLRPKNLLVRLAAQLAHACGCRMLRLVGNGNRAVVRSRRQGKVLADYDAMWREMGALPRPDGDFDLACAPLAAPDLADVPSKKRAEARRRHELLEQACAGLLRQLAPAFVTHPEPPAGGLRSTIDFATAACAVPN